MHTMNVEHFTSLDFLLAILQGFKFVFVTTITSLGIFDIIFTLYIFSHLNNAKIYAARECLRSLCQFVQHLPLEKKVNLI